MQHGVDLDQSGIFIGFYFIGFTFPHNFVSSIIEEVFFCIIIIIIIIVNKVH